MGTSAQWAALRSARGGIGAARRVARRVDNASPFSLPLSLLLSWLLLMLLALLRRLCNIFSRATSTNSDFSVSVSNVEPFSVRKAFRRPTVHLAGSSSARAAAAEAVVGTLVSGADWRFILIFFFKDFVSLFFVFSSNSENCQEIGNATSISKDAIRICRRKMNFLPISTRSKLPNNKKGATNVSVC